MLGYYQDFGGTRLVENIQQKVVGRYFGGADFPPVRVQAKYKSRTIPVLPASFFRSGFYWNPAAE